MSLRFWQSCFASLLHVLSRILSSDQVGSGFPFIIVSRILSHHESSTVVHTGQIYNTSDSHHLCLIKQTHPIHQILLTSLSKQSSILISTFKLIFCLLDYILHKSKTLQVLQVQHHLWSSHQNKRLINHTINLVIWLWTLRDLLFIYQLSWTTIPTNFPPMNLTPWHKLKAIIFDFLWAMLMQKLGMIRWFSRKKKTNIQCSLPWTTLLSWKHWRLDLV